MIPYGRQSIIAEDIGSVEEVLKSAFLTQGPKVAEFEGALASYTGAKYVVAVNSATSGLHIACLALGLKAGDILWTSAISFAASANCALYCGAQIDFVDISLQTFNISIDSLRKKLKEAQKNNKLPKVLVVVHFAGRPADMREIWELSKEYSFKIIEDAAHALGAEYEGNKIGSSLYSDATVFSFHPVKIITTGEGGAVATNSFHLAEKLLRLRSHGITREITQYKHEAQGEWYYEQIDLGYNYRMTDLQAALGLSQLKRLDSFVYKRNLLAKKYIISFKELPISIQQNYSECEVGFISSYHLFVIRIPGPCSRREFFEYMRNQNIGVNVHYIPIYHHPYYRNMGFKNGYCENSEKYYEGCVSLPLFPDLTEQEFLFIVESIERYFSK